MKTDISKHEKSKEPRISLKLVAVSALALAALPFKPVLAQVININCTRNISFGRLIPCGSGSITFDPGGTTAQSGCLSVFEAPQAGRCNIVVTGGLQTRPVTVTLNTLPVVLPGGGPDAQFILPRFKVIGSLTSDSKIVFPPSELNSVKFFEIGGRVTFPSGSVVGSYAATATINANFN